MKCVKDVTVSMENTEGYTKNLQDLNQNNGLATLFIFEKHYSLIKKTYKDLLISR